MHLNWMESSSSPEAPRPTGTDISGSGEKIIFFRDFFPPYKFLTFAVPFTGDGYGDPWS
jgi:hypothetical protein